MLRYAIIEILVLRMYIKGLKLCQNKVTKFEFDKENVLRVHVGFNNIADLSKNFPYLKI